MGCCFSKSQEIQELEEELGVLLAEKRKLEAVLKEKSEIDKPVSDTEASTISIIPDIERAIDKEQYATSKVLEFLHVFSGFESDTFKTISQRVVELNSLNSEEKFKKYADLRYEESELQKKMCMKIETSYKVLQEMITNKYHQIDERIEKIQRILKNNSYFSERLINITENFSLISKNNKPDFAFLIEKMNALAYMENEILAIEKSLPTVNEDSFVLLKLKELEAGLSELMKISIDSLKTIEEKFGDVEADAKLDLASLKSIEVNLETYITFSESISNSLKNLQEVENLKEKILKSNKVDQKIHELDRELMMHFSSSGDAKEAACSRLNRVSRSVSHPSLFVNEILKHVEPSKQSLHRTIEILKEKTIKFLKVSAEQDKIILDMTEQFVSLEHNIDEIELKVDELVSADIRDLYKSIPTGDSEHKHSLDEIKKMFSNEEEASNDLAEHIKSLLDKMEFTPRIEKIRSVIRETQAKEILKSKSDLQEKINDLTNKVSSLENEKSLIEKTMSSLKINYEKTSAMAEKMITTCNEKELEISGLKNNLASLQEHFDQVNQDFTRSQDEIDDMTKEIRECKKALRTKENELTELKENLEKAEKMVTICNDKEAEISELKGKLGSLQEKFDHVHQEFTRSLKGIDEMTIDITECRKTLQSKEDELTELKEILEKERLAKESSEKEENLEKES